MNKKYLIYLFTVNLLLLTSVATIKSQLINDGYVESKVASSRFDTAFKTILQKPKWLFADDICPVNVMPEKEANFKNIRTACNNDAEICLENCKDGDGYACYWLAIRLQEKKGINQVYSEALFLRACKQGVSSGCTNRAAAIYNFVNENEKNEKLLKCAADTFEKTCERDDAWGCTMFGSILYYGNGRPKDYKKALEVFAKSCPYGDEDDACSNAKEFIKLIKKENKQKKKKNE